MPEVDTYVYRWNIEPGQREALTLSVIDRENNPVDVAGWEAECEVRADKDRHAPLLYSFPASAIQTTDDGVRITLPVSVSDNFDWSFGFFRVWVTDPEGTETDPIRSLVCAGWIVL